MAKELGHPMQSTFSIHRNYSESPFTKAIFPNVFSLSTYSKNLWIMQQHFCETISYHLVSQSIAALCSCRWPAPCPALASVAMMTMSSGNPVPSPLASMSVAMGMSVLRRTVHTPSPTWLLSRTMWVVSTCRSCRFSCTISSCSESFGGAAVMRVSQDCRREGSTQASWAREPHRHSRLGFGLFSAGNDSITMRFRLME